ncbi:MAG: HD domain-containing protein, partial [Synergistaceae bacterium]|nr:HD domain-containing protein [Synergistaceae bacterium]
VKLIRQADAKYHILEHLRDGSCESEVREYYDSHIYRDEMLDSLIRMLAMTIDFKNESTLSHSIQTAQIAKTLGRCCGVTGEGLDDLYYAGLLHDVGKVKLPEGMLDKNAMLVGENAKIYRKHAEYTREILSNLFEGDIIEIAARHHESPNGKGYPDGLRDADLTTPQKILAAANVASRLIGFRDGKEEAFAKGDLVAMFSGMAERGVLDAKIASALLNNYEKIKADSRSDVMRMHERYGAMKQEYMVCIKKYSQLNNSFYKNNKLFADFCSITNQYNMQH